MGKKEQRRRRAAAEEHVQRNIVEPQMLAAEMRDAGLPVEDVLVNTCPTAEGFIVTCAGCGRTAKLPRDPGEKVGLCPACINSVRDTP